jgi:predicted RNase H-like nuclease (RuvC/YqgF family)
MHQKTVVVTAMITQQDGAVQREQQTFSTMTADLLVLDDWLRQRQIEGLQSRSSAVDEETIPDRAQRPETRRNLER